MLFRSGRRGRPKENRELKKRISLSVLPSIYEEIQKIAYVKRRSVSNILETVMEDYINKHRSDLVEYDKIQNDKN